MTENEIQFNNACLYKMNNCEYIQLLYHPKKNILVIRSSSKQDPYAFHWITNSKNNIKTAKRKCSNFSKILFSYFNWNKNYKYIFQGIMRYRNNEKIILFDLSNLKIILKESTIENFITKHKYITLYPKKLVENFGDDIYEGEMNYQLRLIDVLGFWDVYDERQNINMKLEWFNEANKIVNKYLTEIKYILKEENKK